MKNIKSTLLIVGLIALAVGWRIINHKYQLAPNLELVTLVSVVAALSYGWRMALIVPLATMAISDAIIGNSSILFFTWGSFALIGLSALVLRKLNDRPRPQILASAGFVLLSSLAFFIITNFGVWAEGWYPATWAGLVESYQAAIPFYRTMLIGNVIMVPVAVAVYQYVKVHQTTKSSVVYQ